MINNQMNLKSTRYSKEEKIYVTVPTRRIDISIKEDLIEEVGRIYGIDNIKGKEMVLPVRRGNIDRTNRDIRRLLSSLGINETLTYSLIKESESHKYTNDIYDSIRLLDPMTEERSTLRYSLIPSLFAIYNYNAKRNNKDVCIFEIAKSFGKNETGYLTLLIKLPLYARPI